MHLHSIARRVQARRGGRAPRLLFILILVWAAGNAPACRTVHVTSPAMLLAIVPLHAGGDAQLGVRIGFRNSITVRERDGRFFIHVRGMRARFRYAGGLMLDGADPWAKESLIVSRQGRPIRGYSILDILKSLRADNGAYLLRLGPSHCPVRRIGEAQPASVAGRRLSVVDAKLRVRVFPDGTRKRSESVEVRVIGPSAERKVLAFPGTFVRIGSVAFLVTRIRLRGPEGAVAFLESLAPGCRLRRGIPGASPGPQGSRVVPGHHLSGEGRR